MPTAITNTGASPTSSARSGPTRRPRGGRTLNMGHGLWGLFLALSLSACGHQCPAPVPPEVVRIRPAESLTLQTPRPALLGTDNGALEDFVDELDAALEECNADKKAIRDSVSAPVLGVSHTTDPTPAASTP